MRTITKDQLVGAGATCAGLKYFIKRFGETLEIKCDLDEYMQAIILGDEIGRQYWGWLVHFGFIPAYSMIRWNLSGANLFRADLSGADLSGANLSEANLSEAKYDDATEWPAGFEPADVGEASRDD